MYVCLPRVCLVPMEVRRVFDALELEVRVVVSHHVGVLETGPWSSTELLTAAGMALLLQLLLWQIPKITSKGVTVYFNLFTFLKMAQRVKSADQPSSMI